MTHDALTMAIDRSARVIDQDGRLHVAISNLSKANICPYYGHEIPGGEAMGLIADKVYNLYRHPEELKKAVDSSNNIPLMDDHIIISADDPKQDRVAGSTGTDGVFVDPFLRNSLVVWVKESIDRIMSGQQRQISMAYRYDVDLTPGTHNGLTYDGIMRNLRFNHAALVKEGRAGPDVLVADALPGGLLMKFQAIKPKLAAKFATDAALNTADRQRLYLALDAIEEEVDAEDEMEEAEVEEKAKEKAADKKAKDAKRAKDKKAKEKAARDKLVKDGWIPPQPDVPDASKAEDEMEDDNDDDSTVDPAKKAADKAAKDAAMDARIEAGVKAGVAAFAASLSALQVAKDAVAPHVGTVALDSAEAVYRFALDAAGVDHKAVKEVSALKAMVSMIPAPGSVTGPRIAQDSKGAADVVVMFPQLARISN